MIRTWSIQSYSLVSLKGLLMKYLTSSAAAAEREEQETAEDGRDGGHSRRASNLHNNNHTTHHRSVSSDAESKGDPNNPFVAGANSFGFGAMAISPITLLHEWTAHKSPLISSKHRTANLVTIIIFNSVWHSHFGLICYGSGESAHLQLPC